MLFGRSQSKTYGLQILDHEIKCVGLQVVNRQFQMLEQFSLPLPPGSMMKGRVLNRELVIQNLQKLVYEHQMQHANVVLTIPTANILIRRSKFQNVKDRELRNLVDVELHGEDKLPFKNPVFDYMRIGEPTEDGQVELLIFATPEELISSYSGLIKAAELKLKGIDIGSLALLRILANEQSPVDRGSHLMILNMESDHADVCILKDGLPTFLRSIALSSSNVMYSANGALESYCRTLSMEISRITNFYKYSLNDNASDIDFVFLSGQADYVNEAPMYLRNQFHGQIGALPLPNVTNLDEAIWTSYAVPLGLAMKGGIV